MKISQSARVQYENNPLAEVICQIRFHRLTELDSTEQASFSAALGEHGYLLSGKEQINEITLEIGASVQQFGAGKSPRSIFHYTSGDANWRLSVCSEFMALSCSRYTNWSDFLSRMTAAAGAFAACFPEAIPTRIGLRYKDVIEREALDLNGARWDELVSPFLLGPLMPGALADGEVPLDGDVANMLSQTLLQLDDCRLLLQSAILLAIDGNKRAFLIDADFFEEGDLPPAHLHEECALSRCLEKLHNNAGSLFRRCITEKLHAALRPRSA
ncbi:TIGR04255 family protein [Ralstonia solanacearum]|uniref:TIGR04255 family protein n=1 Tax=Ralstonia solanacearum TaxID=305 RepID=A0AAE3NL00_RALSL|nr:TIGR04255 family protein [Ralstonia solanacearum]MBB6582769.1 TIGR04255 family protein [Ralstonia solanacearum]MDB0522411.1 TIGR04255 family protein [Ralstonia solanacearum]